jgi:hypothetical protein
MQDTGRCDSKLCKSTCTWYWIRRSLVVRPTSVQLTDLSFGVVTEVKAQLSAQTFIDRKPLYILYKCFLV